MGWHNRQKHFFLAEVIEWRHQTEIIFVTIENDDCTLKILLTFGRKKTRLFLDENITSTEREVEIS